MFNVTARMFRVYLSLVGYILASYDTGCCQSPSEGISLCIPFETPALSQYRLVHAQTLIVAYMVSY